MRPSTVLELAAREGVRLPDTLTDAIRMNDLQRIVLAGGSPGYFRPVFARSMQAALKAYAL